MVRLTLLNHDGTVILPKDLTTAADVRDAIDQARNLILECNRVVVQKIPAGSQSSQQPAGVPYLS